MRNYILKQYILLLLPCFMLPFFTSCFTGVEGTKKITLSKDDRKAIKSSEEEMLLASIIPIPLSDWKPGRPFYASDNRAILIFDQQGLPILPDSAGIGGTTLLYKGSENRITPDGKNSLSLIFSSEDGSRFVYNTGKTNEEAQKGVRSDNIPMLIDLGMIEEASELLKGRQLWTRTALWYDDKGNRIPGRKFVPVTITEVTPGSMVFPLKIGFVDEQGNRASLFLNFGNSGTDSRSFAHMFYLNDVRKRYASISDDVWEMICNEQIRQGMTKDECKLSLGNPTEVSAGHDYSQTLDLWHYPDGTVLWFEDGLLTRFRK